MAIDRHSASPVGLAAVGISLVMAVCGPVAAAESETAGPTAVPSVPAAALQDVIVPGAPNTIGVTGDRLWVELHRSNTIAAVDPTAMTATTYSIPVHCSIDGDGIGAVWAAYHQGNLLTRIDAGSGRSALEVTIPDACGVGVTADQVWATSPSASKIYRVDPTTGATILEIDVRGTPFVVAPFGDVVYASGEGGGGWLSAFDSGDGHELATLESPDVVLIDTLAVGFDSLWATGRMDNRLYRLSPLTLEVEAMVEIGDEPSGVTVTEDAVWVSRLAGRLVRVDPATNAVRGTWALPYTWLSWPTYAFDRLWLTSLEEDAVIAVDIGALESP